MFVVLDTNHFREFAHGTPLGKRLLDQIQHHKAEVFSCVIVAEESLQGWISLIRRDKAGPDQIRGYRYLQQSIDTLARMTILPFDEEAAEIFCALRSLKLRTGTMDFKIASICLVHDTILLTRNLADFREVPGLKVDNWLD